MGNEQSAPSKTEGKVDGRPVTFTYQHDNGEGQETALIWQEHETSKIGNPKTGQLSDKDIIATLPVHQQFPDDYSILCVAPNPASKDDPRASPVIFRSILVTSLPSSFIHDYQPGGDSCWQIRADDGQFPNLHIVVSHGSGVGQAESVWNKLLKPMTSHVCPKADSFALHFTTSEHTITDLTKELFLPQANLGVAQQIILLSGDGGLVDIINALLSGQHGARYLKPNIALLPVGTGNAMAHSARITQDNTMGLKTMLQGAPKELPLFRATFSLGARQLVNEGRTEIELQNWNGAPTTHGAVVCSWGLHATLVADSDTAEYRKFGAKRFQMAAKEALFPSDGSPPHAYKGKVSVLLSSAPSKDSRQSIDTDAHGYVLATLVSQLEKGFTISPSSRPLDGKLRLIHFRHLDGEAAMDIMGKAYKGGVHIEDERVGYEEIEGLRIQFEEDDERWRRVCVDGKIVKVEKGGWVEVRGGVRGVADLVVIPS